MGSREWVVVGLKITSSISSGNLAFSVKHVINMNSES